MRKLLFSATSALVAASCFVAACETDNGPNVYGDQYEPPGGKVDAAGPDATPVGPEGDASGGGDGGGSGGDGSAGGDGGGGSDAGADATLPCPGGGTIVVLAGNDTTLSGSARIDGKPWSGGAIAGGASKAAPALVDYGGVFVGATHGAGDALQWVKYDTTFSAPAAIGVANVKNAPALALGGKLEVAYSAGPGTNTTFFHGEYDLVQWDDANDPVGLTGQQTFGNSTPGFAFVGGGFVLAQDGTDEGLYLYDWAGTWTKSTGSPIFGAGTYQTTVGPVVLEIGGAGATYDGLVLYADNTNLHTIGYALRTAATKTWGNASVANAKAQTSTPFAAARISATSLLVTFEGNDGKPYVMTGTIAASGVTFADPALLAASGAGTVGSAPAVAKGVCGDGAIAVFASAGQVKATRLKGSSWSAPESVSGASGSRAAVATH